MGEDQATLHTYAEYLANHVPLEVKTRHGFDRQSFTSECHLASDFCPFEGKDDSFTVFVARECKLLSEEVWHVLLDEALDLNEEERIRSLVCTDIDLYGQNKDLFPTIHLACMAKTSRFLQHLLEKGADSNLRDDNNETPLIIAAKLGRIDYVQLLIQHNPDVNLSGLEGWAALHHAAWVPALDVVEVLVENGANIDATGNDGSNALHLVCEVGEVNIAAFLISKGINPHLKNKDNTTPLLHAVVGGWEDLVEMLLSPELKGDDQDIINEPSARYGTPLYAAARRGRLGIVRKLLDAGADIDKAALPGNILGPPLFAACAFNQGDIVELLLSRGARTEAEGCQYRTAREVSKAFAQWPVDQYLEKWEQTQQQNNPIEELENKLSTQISDLKMILDKKPQLAPYPLDSAPTLEASDEG